MLTHPNLDKLRQLKCYGMLAAFEEQCQQSDIHTLPFEERIGLLLDREITERENRRLKTRLKQAHLKQSACMEDIDFQHARGLDQSFMLSLASCQWIKDHHNIILLGPAGTGKTYLACALAHKACLNNHSARYYRCARLFESLFMAKADGHYSKIMNQLSKIDVMILDDWCLAHFNNEQRHDMLEILDDRHDTRSTIITSQLPIKHWHEAIGDPTIADAILDRVVHAAYKIQLSGESLRRIKHQQFERELTTST